MEIFEYLDEEGIGWYGVRNPDGVSHAIKMSKDDALLLIVAHDLLELCIEFEKRTYYVSGTHPEALQHNCDVDRLRSTIAKARGEGR